MKAFSVFAAFLLFMAQTLADNEPPTTENETLTSMRPFDRKSSFWTKTVNHLKASNYVRSYKPYANRTQGFKKYPLQQETVRSISTTLLDQKPRRKRIKLEGIENMGAKPTTMTNKDESNTTDDVEDKIMKDESFIKFKEFANQLINETTKYFIRKNRTSLTRSYPIEEPQPQHQLWDDKDQTYYASDFKNAEYEPTSLYHHYIPPPPPPAINYFQPQKKDHTLLGKVALIALLKLLLAKLKAIGFLKLMMFFFMKIPFMILKFLFILKSLKIIKIISIPFLIASFATPFLPLIAFFAPLLFFPLLLFPLFLPLMLPLLFFLPIIPVTTPVTAAASTRTRRETNTSSNWSYIDNIWKKYQTNTTENQARYFRRRGRPSTFQNNNFNHKMNISNSLKNLNKFSQEDSAETINLIQLTQKVVESQHCLERVACELAGQNDSKFYHASVIWALKKILRIAPERIQRKIEKYSQAYETGAQKKSFQYCQQKFFCQRPRIVVIQGQEKYNLI